MIRGCLFKNILVRGIRFKRRKIKRKGRRNEAKIREKKRKVRQSERKRKGQKVGRKEKEEEKRKKGKLGEVERTEQNRKQERRKHKKNQKKLILTFFCVVSVLTDETLGKNVLKAFQKDAEYLDEVKVRFFQEKKKKEILTKNQKKGNRKIEKNRVSFSFSICSLSLFYFFLFSTFFLCFFFSAFSLLFSFYLIFSFVFFFLFVCLFFKFIRFWVIEKKREREENAFVVSNFFYFVPLFFLGTFNISYLFFQVQVIQHYISALSLMSRKYSGEEQNLASNLKRQSVVLRKMDFLTSPVCLFIRFFPAFFCLCFLF